MLTAFKFSFNSIIQHSSWDNLHIITINGLNFGPKNANHLTVLHEQFMCPLLCCMSINSSVSVMVILCLSSDMFRFQYVLISVSFYTEIASFMKSQIEAVLSREIWQQFELIVSVIKYWDISPTYLIIEWSSIDPGYNNMITRDHMKRNPVPRTESGRAFIIARNY